jgi:hypothetical protein
MVRTIGPRNKDIAKNKLETKKGGMVYLENLKNIS